MENSESWLKFARRAACLEVWVNLPGTLLGLDVSSGEDLYVLVAVGGHLLNGQSCPVRSVTTTLQPGMVRTRDVPSLLLGQELYLY